MTIPLVQIIRNRVNAAHSNKTTTTTTSQKHDDGDDDDDEVILPARVYRPPTASTRGADLYRPCYLGAEARLVWPCRRARDRHWIR